MYLLLHLMYFFLIIMQNNVFLMYWYFDNVLINIV